MNAGPVVRELLAQRYGSLEAADAFGGRALAAGACDGRGLEAVLSRRELAVLALLPSLRSMDEIACDLSVLINTVKNTTFGRSTARSASAVGDALRLPPRTRPDPLVRIG